MINNAAENYENIDLTSDNYLSGDPTPAYERLYGRCQCEFCSKDSIKIPPLISNSQRAPDEEET